MLEGLSITAGLEITDKFLRRVRIDTYNRETGTTHPTIRGKYRVLVKINHCNVGDICDSRGGKIHGVWNPSIKCTIPYDNKHYFQKVHD